MPHKHKRKRDDNNSHFDLDPTVEAKPLPAYKPPSVFSSESSNKRRRSNTSTSKIKTQDDTPKAFARMMAWQTTGKRPSGLDDGSYSNKAKSTPSKKSHRHNDAATSRDSDLISKNTISAVHAVDSTSASQPPKILPGESLSQFSLRVDQSLPLSSIPKSSTQNPIIPSDIKPQGRITKHNKRLQRMISDWRGVDARLKEERDEEDEDLEEKREEEGLLWDVVKSANLDRKGKKKSRGKGTIDDDPWKDLEKRRRDETKQKNLQDVVQAPPLLVKVKNKFKTKEEDLSQLDSRQRSKDTNTLGVDVKDVPNAVGSLRKREAVSQKRREVIEGYRKLQGKRLKGKGLSIPLPRSIIT